MARHRRGVRAAAVGAAVAFVAVVLGACGSGSDEPEPRPAASGPPASLDGVPGLRAVELARVPEMPTDLVVRDGTMFVAGRQGRVFELPLGADGTPESHRPSLAVDLDLRGQTSVDGERGLLAIEPLGDDLLALSRTRLDGTVVVELVRVGSDGRLSMADRQPVLEIDHPATYHNGGALVVHDGDLLVSMGDDEQIEGDPPPSQDPSSPLGSIVRVPAEHLDPDAAGGPFEPGEDDLMAIGLRNPWRVALDRETGVLWIGEVGAGSIEEVNLLPADHRGAPLNYGWPVYEGDAVAHGGSEPEDHVLPVFMREHGDGVCAIIGGHVYRGDALGGLHGVYVYGDYCSTEVRALVAHEGEVRDDRSIARLDEPPVAFAEGPGGALLALGAYGGIFRIEEGAPDERSGTRLDAEVACRTQEAFVVLQHVPTMDASELEHHFTAARDAAAEVAAAGDPDLERAATEVRDGFEWAVGTGSRAGWAPDDPAVAGIIPALTSGEDEHAYFALAMEELLARFAGLCGS